MQRWQRSARRASIRCTVHGRLKRAIQQEIENPVAKLVLEGKFGPKDVIPVDFKNGKFTFDRIVH